MKFSGIGCQAVMEGVMMKNKADYNKRWYQCSPWELKIYKNINIKTTNLFNNKYSGINSIKNQIKLMDILKATML